MDNIQTGSQTVQNWNPALGATEADAIAAALGQIEQQLPFLIGLTTIERRRLAKVGNRTRPFVQDTVAMALAHPGVVPRSVDLAQLSARAETLTRLAEVRARLASLLEKVGDTEMKLGNTLFAVSRSVYSVLKTPATEPGLKDRKDRLAQRFARSGKRRPEEARQAAA